MERLSPLLPAHTASALVSVLEANYTTPEDINSPSALTPLNYSDESLMPVGLLVADKPGHEFKVIDDPIPEQYLDLLIGRLLHKTIVQKSSGANSYFIRLYWGDIMI